MLPILKPKKAASTIISQRKDKSVEVKAEEPNADPLSAECEALLSAIDDRSIMGMSKALRDAFHKLDAEPHVEGEHLEEE